MYETIKKAGYKHILFKKDTKEHLLYNKDTKHVEVFRANKNHSGWALIYKNTHLEFCYSFILPCDDYNFARD